MMMKMYYIKIMKKKNTHTFSSTIECDLFTERIYEENCNQINIATKDQIVPQTEHMTVTINGPRMKMMKQTNNASIIFNKKCNNFQFNCFKNPYYNHYYNIHSIKFSRTIILIGFIFYVICY